VPDSEAEQEDPQDNTSAPASTAKPWQATASKLQNFWRLTRLPIKLALAATCVAAISVAGIWFWARTRPVLPESLLDRAALVTKSFAQNQPEVVEALVAPELVAEVSNWFRRSRPELWKSELGDEVAITVTANIMAEDRVAGTACVRTSFVVPAGIFTDESRTSGKAARAKHRAGGEFNFVLFWILDEYGVWLLDMEHTLKASPHGND
jgi:hypothetical protein